MKRSIIITLLLALAATAAFGQTQRGSNNAVRDTLIAIERDLWEAWKNKNTAPFERHLSADSIGVGMSGVENRAAILRGIGSHTCEVRSYSLDNFEVVMLNPNTAILTYKGTQDATCGGQVIPREVWASTVFVRRSGRWQAAFHQETPAPPATP